MKTKLMGKLCAGLLLFGITSTAAAALIPTQGGQAVIDTDLGLMWLADANLALTNQFGLTLSTAEVDDSPNTVGSTGKMTWANANAWITGLNAASYLGFNDWILPEIVESDSSCSLANAIGFGCTGSPMGHLFYSEFGATAGLSATASGDLAETSKFTNIQPFHYWSSTIYSPDPNLTRHFNFGNGDQTADFPTANLQVWAVRAVPIPAAVWLFGTGLVGLMGVARRKVRA